MSETILIIEDDDGLSRLLQLDLERNGYRGFVALDGETGLQMFRQANPQLVILDIALPDISGWEICKQIRQMSNVPILLMSAHAVSEEEIAEGLNLGADEYMIKPLGKIEFLARVKALLRRASFSDFKKPIFYKDDYLHIDLNARQVRVGSDEIRLTPTEFNLLATFIQNSGQVLTFQQILEKVWGVEYKNEHHYPRIYVSHLRRKIEPDFKNPTYIHNEYGVGYRFVAKSIQ